MSPAFPVLESHSYKGISDRVYIASNLMSVFIHCIYQNNPKAPENEGVKKAIVKLSLEYADELLLQSEGN